MLALFQPERLGAPDPELKNSPFAEETDEEYEVLRREVPGEPVCYFNDQSFRHGSYVCSGSTLLRCDYGLWVPHGQAVSTVPGDVRGRQTQATAQ